MRSIFPHSAPRRYYAGAIDIRDGSLVTGGVAYAVGGNVYGFTASRISVTDSTVSKGFAGTGGCIIGWASSALTLDGAVFSGCVAQANIGALAAFQGSTSVAWSTLTDNHALGGVGGAVGCVGNSRCEFAESYFADNSCAAEGGALEIPVAAKIANCTFERNSALYGGAVALVGSDASVGVSGSRFLDNEATLGGALCGVDGAAAMKIVRTTAR